MSLPIAHEESGCICTVAFADKENTELRVIGSYKGFEIVTRGIFSSMQICLILRSEMAFTASSDMRGFTVRTGALIN